MARDQRGQVMVLMALMIVAMIGALGIAIDGGRLYVDRRLLQNAADAAALAAADAYTGAIRSLTPTPACGANVAATTTAYNAGQAEFSDQVQGASGYSVTLTEIATANTTDPAGCIFKASATHSLHAFLIPVVDSSFASIPVQTQAAAVSAQNLPGAVLFLLDPSDVSGPKTCGTGNGDSFGFGGGGALQVNGSVVSDGNLQKWTSNNVALSIYDNGVAFDLCDTSMSSAGATCWIATPMPTNPPSCGASSGTARFHGHVGPLPDPLGTSSGALNWAAGWFATPYATNYTGQSATKNLVTTNVELAPGVYPTDPFPNGGCWFLEPGVYTWSKGLSSTSGQGLISNELTPPAGTDSGPLPNQEDPAFSWYGGGNGYGNKGSGNKPAGDVGCVGAIHPYFTNTAATTYYIKVASARNEKVPGTACSGGCWRESYLSNSTLNSGCYQVKTDLLDTVTVAISNVPGMGNTAPTLLVPNNRYDIFASTGGCSSNSWGYLGSASFGTAGTQLQGGPPNGFSACPTTFPVLNPAIANTFVTDACPLGGIESAAFTSAQFLLATTSNGICPVSAPVPGCSPAYLGNTAVCAALTSGLSTPCADTANEHYCTTASPPVPASYCNFFAPTQSDVTPGGVLYYVPSTASACIKMTNGGNQHYVFGDAGLFDVIVYAPDNCNATINGGSGGEFTGWGYMPGPNDTIGLQGNGTPFNGGLDVWQLTILGGANLNIPGGIPVQPFPIGVRLIRCTNTTPGCPPP